MSLFDTLFHRSIDKKITKYSRGILTSLNGFTLVRELNDEFDVQIGADKLLPENFESVDAIEKLIIEIQDK